MHMAVINAEQLQIQETSCGEYTKIHKSLLLCHQNRTNILSAG